MRWLAVTLHWEIVHIFQHMYWGKACTCSCILIICICRDILCDQKCKRRCNDLFIFISLNLNFGKKFFFKKNPVDQYLMLSLHVASLISHVRLNYFCRLHQVAKGPEEEWCLFSKMIGRCPLSLWYYDREKVRVKQFWMVLVLGFQ